MFVDCRAILRGVVIILSDLGRAQMFPVGLSQLRTHLGMSNVIISVLSSSTGAESE